MGAGGLLASPLALPQLFLFVVLFPLKGLCVEKAKEFSWGGASAFREMSDVWRVTDRPRAAGPSSSSSPQLGLGLTPMSNTP